MVPEVSTLRTRLSPVSAMNRLPVGSYQMPCGAFSWARDAGPASPHALAGAAQAIPVPASGAGVDAPVVVNTMCALLSAMAMFVSVPVAVAATPDGAMTVGPVAVGAPGLGRVRLTGLCAAAGDPDAGGVPATIDTTGDVLDTWAMRRTTPLAVSATNASPVLGS